MISVSELAVPEEEQDNEELVPYDEPFYANQMEDPRYMYYLFDI